MSLCSQDFSLLVLPLSICNIPHRTHKANVLENYTPWEFRPRTCKDSDTQIPNLGASAGTAVSWQDHGSSRRVPKLWSCPVTYSETLAERAYMGGSSHVAQGDDVFKI